MKKTRKALAFVLSAGMMLVCFDKMTFVSAEETKHILTTTIDENGVIHSVSGDENGTETYYTLSPDYHDISIEYRYKNQICVSVVPTDVNAFQEYCTNRYGYLNAYYDMENTFIVNCTMENVDNSNTNTENLTYENAQTIASEFMRLKLAKEISIGYVCDTHSYTDIPPIGTVKVYADKTLTEEDFSWVSDSCKVEIKGNYAYLTNYTSITNTNADKNAESDNDSAIWAAVYQLIIGAMEKIDSVYGVKYDPYSIIALFRANCQPISTYTAQITGDITGDFEVDTFDAYEALLYCAKEGAGYDAAFTDGDEVKETAAYASADVNGDGKIDTNDAYLILKYYAEKSAGYTPSWD